MLFHIAMHIIKLNVTTKAIINGVKSSNIWYIKKLLKDKKISEDESKDFESQVQKNTDEKILTIEKILTEKEKEILTLWIKSTISPL